MELFVSLITAFANTTLGLFTYLKNPNSATNKLFAFLTFQISLWSVTNYYSLNSSTEAATLFWIRIVMFIASAMGPTIFLLFRSFPNNTTGLSRKTLILISGLILLTGTLALSPFMFVSVDISGGNVQPTPGPATGVFALNFLGFLTTAIITLIKRYKKATGMERSQLKFLILGVVSTFALVAITNFIFVVLLKISAFVVLGPFFSLLLVGSIAYAIIKHRFLDIGLLVFRAVSFTLITTIIIAIYATGVFTSLSFISTKYQTYVSIVLALILVYTYPQIKKAIEKLTKNIFYKQPYSSEKLLEKLGKIVRSNLIIRSLSHKVLRELSSTMQVSKAMFIIVTKEENDHKHTLHQTGFKNTSSFTKNAIHNLNSAVKTNILYFDGLEESSIKMLMRQLEISVAIPLRVKNTNHGLLVLGEKSSGEIYSQQDTEVLEIFAPQISIAIQNAKSYDEIKHFADTLKEEVDKATKDLKKANKHLRHLDKLKDEFVFIATHELKNPVTAMRGYLSMIQEGTFGKIPAKMKDPVSQIQTSNQQLVELVNDLLQIARSEAKTLTFNTSKVEICPLVDSTIGNVKPLYEQKGLIVTHKCDSQKLTVKADENKLKEIINNLISNAIKYSSKGTISITHQVEKDSITTHVTDQGDGIAKKNQNKIFTRFYRVEEEAAKGIPGTGLGLFIVKQLVEKMGGKIWFESTLGTGTTFSFSLPKPS